MVALDARADPFSNHSACVAGRITCLPLPNGVQRSTVPDVPQLTRPAFHRAIEAYDVAASELDADTTRHLRDQLSLGRILLVGEPHGVHETPAILYGLIHAIGAKAVGLEWPTEEFGGVARALLAGDPPDWNALWRRPRGVFRRGDGRVTAGHFAVLRRLAAEDQLQQIVLFDAPDTSRERGMAEQLLRAWDRRLPIIVLVGAKHAVPSELLRRFLPLVGGDDVDATMAGHLASELPGLSIALLEYASGRGWHHGEYCIPSLPVHPLLALPAGVGHPAAVPEMA